jgi:hypothetical protein
VYADDKLLKQHSREISKIHASFLSLFIQWFMAANHLSFPMFLFLFCIFLIIYSLGLEISVDEFVLSHRHLFQIRGSKKYIYYYSQHILFLSPYSCVIFYEKCVLDSDKLQGANAMGGRCKGPC